MNFLHLQERVTCLIQVNFYNRIFVVVGFQFFYKWCKPHETRKRWRNFAPWINDNQLLKETASKSLKLSQEAKKCVTFHVLHTAHVPHNINLKIWIANQIITSLHDFRWNPTTILTHQIQIYILKIFVIYTSQRYYVIRLMNGLSLYIRNDIEISNCFVRFNITKVHSMNDMQL